MIISITSEALANSKPTSVGSNSISLDYDNDHTFTLANFTTETSPQYFDPEGDSLLFVRITELPSSGQLELDGVAVSSGDDIYSGSISTGNFKYISNRSIITQSSTFFKFDIADEGSSRVSGLSTGIMNISVLEKENLPPSNIDDNSISSEHGEQIIFSESNFTLGYSDPEGDDPFSIKILSLPSSGQLTLSGSLVVVNQEILFTEISSGYLRYSQDPLDTDAESYSFQFSVSDAGSKTFTA